MQPLSPTKPRSRGWTRHGSVLTSTLADARETASRLRYEDRRELEEILGRTAEQAMLGFVLYGAPCLTLRHHDGALVGMVAAVPLGAHTASVGMAGTTEITNRSSTGFLRGSREVLERLHQRYDGLVCTADARNDVHLGWLEWLGFVPLRRLSGYGARSIEAIEFASIRRSPINV